MSEWVRGQRFPDGTVGIRTDEGEIVAIATPEHVSLIAAAPDLLEALRLVMEVYADTYHAPEEEHHEGDCLICQAHAAIDKATGNVSVPS